MKYGRIKALRQHYPVAVICRVFEVSQSGYYAWRERPRSLRAQENARLEVEIRAAHQRTRETCGPERLQSDLADYGIKVGVDRIRRIRKKRGTALQAETEIQSDHRFQTQSSGRPQPAAT